MLDILISNLSNELTWCDAFLNWFLTKFWVFSHTSTRCWSRNHWSSERRFVLNFLITSVHNSCRKVTSILFFFMYETAIMFYVLKVFTYLSLTLFKKIVPWCRLIVFFFLLKSLSQLKLRILVLYLLLRFHTESHRAHVVLLVLLNLFLFWTVISGLNHRWLHFTFVFLV